jgi:hypothetical protein|nr:MAG TPA: hypothetical protein [Caudoviricetes sp.]
MECTILSGALLPNQSGMYHAKNPWETHIYKHTIETAETKLFKEHRLWYLTGDVPLDLTIDNNGVISGQILILNNQPSCKDNLMPVEKIKLDGSNWRSTGRYRDATKTFEFQVHRKYYTWEVVKIEGKDGATPPLTLETLKMNYKVETFDLYKTMLETLTTAECTLTFKEEEVSGDVSIMAIRNNDLDTRIYLEEYIKSNVSFVKGIPVRHAIFRHGKKYMLENFLDFQREY